MPWTSGEIALARAFGGSLVDIILQVNAVRLLIAEHQLAQTRVAVANSREPVVIADARCQVLFANDAFLALVQRTRDPQSTREEIASYFSQPALAREMLSTMVQERRAWRGQLDLARGNGGPLLVGVRAELVPARDGSVLGFFLIFDDLTESQRAAMARQQLEQSLSMVRRNGPGLEAQADEVMAAVLANASIAAMDIADGSGSASVVGLLEEIDASTQRAASLYANIRRFTEH